MEQESKVKNSGGRVALVEPRQQVVLVFQGGGALGSFQAGVYQAMHEAGIEPDWIVGTSIGAINASLIAGNAPEERVEKLKEFWERVTQRSMFDEIGLWPQLSRSTKYFSALWEGVPGFFKPNPVAYQHPHYKLGPEGAAYYSVKELRKTLTELVDFGRINKDGPRLTVGAAQVKSSKMRYFDSREMPVAIEHVLASGALPPAFPAVRIEGELYWDGGILSNTPTEVIFEDNPRRNALIFAVHLWNPDGAEPETIWEVLHRHKDIQYSSRVANHIVRQKQTHRLRHVIKQLAAYLPEDIRKNPEVRELESWGCTTQMHIVRLLAPMLANDDHTKDADFSASGIRQRWQAGYENTMKAIEHAPWQAECDPLEGVILHEPPYTLSSEGDSIESVVSETAHSTHLSAAE